MSLELRGNNTTREGEASMATLLSLNDSLLSLVRGGRGGEGGGR